MGIDVASFFLLFCGDFTKNFKQMCFSKIPNWHSICVDIEACRNQNNITKNLNEEKKDECSMY